MFHKTTCVFLPADVWVYLQSRGSRHVSSILPPTHMTSTLHHFMVTSVRPSSFLSDVLSPCCGFLSTDCSSRVILKADDRHNKLQQCTDFKCEKTNFLMEHFFCQEEAPWPRHQIQAYPATLCHMEASEEELWRPMEVWKAHKNDGLLIMVIISWTGASDRSNTRAYCLDMTNNKPFFPVLIRANNWSSYIEA